MKREQIANPTARHYFFEILKAVIVAVIISLAAILILAFLIKTANIPSDTIPIINQVIKGVSILTACLLCLKLPKNGWLRGLAVGIVYILLAFLIFSLLNSAKFSFGLNLLNDIALGSVSGLLSGIIAGLIRKKK
ncbi:MAG: TIGR04086 family membrane protein [Firmicutes bacterium]|nr:TIGR04086 family membrane protein [Bacillota bacterium]